MSSQPGSRFLSLPNILTMLRFILIPVFAVMILQNRPLAALLVICLAGASDVLDGFAARKLKLQSELGVLIDPLADKALGATAFVLLSMKGLGGANVIPLWLTATVLGRDLLIVLGGLVISLVRGRRKFPPTVLGKISTVLQVTTVSWVVLANYVQASAWQLRPGVAWATSQEVLSLLYAVTLVFTVMSGIQYVGRGIRQMWPGKV
jgi:cardiolipin synthase